MRDLAHDLRMVAWACMEGTMQMYNYKADT